ncbi:MAG: tetratricopeptide repeat protein [Trueperaceae bacterium]
MKNLEQILDTLWNYNDAAKSEAIFKDFVKQEIGDEAEILTQIARAQGLQGKFEEAHATLDSISTPNDERIKVRYLLERGRVYNSAKQKEEARKYFLEAYELSKRIGADFYTIDAAHMMAIVEPPAQQLLWHEICLELCETTKDERAKKWLGLITNNAAWTYHDLGQYDKALEVFQKALLWHEVNGKPETIRIAKWSVARALRSLERYQEALDKQLGLLSETKDDGYIYEEVAECFLALEKSDEAKPYFAKAHDMLSQDAWLVKNEGGRLERLRTLGEL